MTSYTLTATATDRVTGKASTKTASFNVNVSVFAGSTSYNSSGYGTSDTVARLQAFDAAVGRPMATRCGKYYLNEGNLPATVPANMRAMGDAGVLIYICFKPSKTLTASQQSALAACLDAIEAAKINYKVILYQEPNTSDFATALAYQQYCQFYGPVVRAHSSKPIVYDPSSGPVFMDPTTMYPGDQWADEVVTDYYCSSYTHASSSNRLDNLAALADGHTSGSTSTVIGQNGNGTHAPVAFGLGEWGGSASNITPTLADWTTFTNYLASFFSSRAAAGKVNAPLIYFNDVSTASQPENFIASVTDFKVPQIQLLYDTLKGL